MKEKGCVRHSATRRPQAGTTHDRRSRGGHEKHQLPPARVIEQWARPPEKVGAVYASAYVGLFDGQIRFSVVVEFPTSALDFDGSEIIGRIFGHCAAGVDHFDDLIHCQSRGR